MLKDKVNNKTLGWFLILISTSIAFITIGSNVGFVVLLEFLAGLAAVFFLVFMFIGGIFLIGE